MKQGNIMDIIKKTIREKLPELRVHAVWIPYAKELSDEKFIDLAYEAELQRKKHSGDFWKTFENIVFLYRSKAL